MRDYTVLEICTGEGKQVTRLSRAGQTRTFLRFRVFAHPMRRHFSDAMGEVATVLEKMRTRR